MRLNSLAFRGFRGLRVLGVPPGEGEGLGLVRRLIHARRGGPGRRGVFFMAGGPRDALSRPASHDGVDYRRTSRRGRPE
jgi:hypothetical protein